MIELVDARDPHLLIDRLAGVLAGGPPIHPYAGTPPSLPPHDVSDLPPGLAVLVGTSGSTGTPKLALHTGESLLASARASYAALAGPGQWLLAIPPQHIAGLQVLIRSLVAGTTPVVMERDGPFGAAAFDAATEKLAPGTAYTSLVPTQVARLLADPAGAAALRRFTAVLTGGAAVPVALRRRATQAGVRLVATYGMSESAGGCVYDGVPLPGVQVTVDDDGRIHLGGPVIAHGYLGRPAETSAAFTDHPPPGRPPPRMADPDERTRWFATDDVGEIGSGGILRVLGRRDDVITTGGLKVHPRPVEEAVLAAYPRLSGAVAVGVPDAYWGQAVAVAVTGEQPPTLEELRERLRATLPAHALPGRLRHTHALPERGPGKPDRGAIAAWWVGE